MANYEQLGGRLSAVDVDAYLAEEEPAAPLCRELKPDQLCAFSSGNAFVHDLPASAKKPVGDGKGKGAASRELRQVRFGQFPLDEHSHSRVFPATRSVLVCPAARPCLQ
eukprot:COSAG02_NODE_26626_length_626_cov_2552.873346_2_plen_109_part_00